MISIRPYRTADAGAIYEAARESIAEVGPWMPWCYPRYSIDDARSYLEQQTAAFERRSAFEFAIIASDGSYCGGCGLNRIDIPDRRANLAYWVRSSRTRRGMATAAVRLIHEWAFRHTDLVRLEVVVATSNTASCLVAEKAGAHREGVLRSRVVLDGRAHDAVMFSFTRSVPQGPAS
jgi:ribosomal-protein-serine acetyltransferase